MSAFVNYKKRDASLPKGCKDLMDVLHGKKASPPFQDVSELIEPSQNPNLSPEQRERLRKFEEDAKRAVPRRETATGRLADVEAFIARVYQSKALSACLNVGAPENMPFHLDRCWEKDIAASVWVEEGTELHRRTKAFLVAHDLEMPDETGVPSVLFAQVPVTVLCRFRPLPADSRMLAALATGFFRDVCLLDDTSEMAFEFVELIVPP